MLFKVRIIFLVIGFSLISNLSFAADTTVSTALTSSDDKIIMGSNDTVTITSSGSIIVDDHDGGLIQLPAGTSNLTIENSGTLQVGRYGDVGSSTAEANTIAAGAAENITIINNGLISASNHSALSLAAAEGDITITNNAGAMISARSSNSKATINLNTAGSTTAGDIRITNAGTIQALGAPYNSQPNTYSHHTLRITNVTNGGTVTIDNSGTIEGGACCTIDLNGTTDATTLTNSGTIKGYTAAVISGRYTTNLTINNSGTITGAGTTFISSTKEPDKGSVVLHNFNGSGGSGATITNSGTIEASGLDYHAITIGTADTGSLGYDNVTITNSGTIAGDQTAGDGVAGHAIRVLADSSGTTITVKGEAAFTGGIDLGKTVSTIVLDSSISTNITINIYNYDADLEIINNLSGNDTYSLSSVDLDSDTVVDDGVLTIIKEPTLSSSSPADGATSVGVNDNIVLTFSEAVDAESGNIVIKKSSDDSIVETIDVTGSKVSGSGSTTITIDPSTTLDQATGYYITIAATAFDNASSVSYAGISDATTLNFNTGASNPLDDKDVVGSIEAQVDVAKQIIHHSTIPVLDRMEWLRRHREENNLSHQGIKISFSNPMFTSISSVLPVSTYFNPTAEVLPNDWAMWTKGSITIGKTSGTDLASLKDIESTGITIGMDKKAGQGLVHGIALRFGRDDVDVGSSGTSLDTDSYSLSIYRTNSYNEKTFLDSLLGISILKTDLIRKSGANTLTGRRYGRQIFGSFSYSGVLNKDQFNLSPSVRLDVGYTNLSSYSETGKDALTYDTHNIKTGKISTGVLLEDTFQFSSITLKPNGRLEYGADFSPSSNAVLSYVSDPNTDYTLSVKKEALHNFRAGIGLDIETVGGLSVTISYERNQAVHSGYSDTMRLGIKQHLNTNIQYALSFDVPDSSSAIFDIQTTSDGFNVNFKLEYSATDEIPHQLASLSLVRSF